MGSNARTTIGIPRVDFRFACAEDTDELVELVNDAFSVEKGDSGLAFRTRYRITPHEVDACMHGESGRKRWLVLETPHPEEKMVAAALICTGNAAGKGSVDVLAVDPSRQGLGMGSHLLRRSEGILLNFRCRFVSLKVPQWREDVLQWASKRGYNETGGGLWGELDGGSADFLSRPTRYFVVTRDLLTDEAVAGTFGDGSARLVSAAAAAAERASAAKANASAAPRSGEAFPQPNAHEDRLVVEKRGVADGHDSPGLAGFLEKALRGLTATDCDRQETEQRCGVTGAHSDVAPVADIQINRNRDVVLAVPGTLRKAETEHRSLPPPLPLSSISKAEDNISCTPTAALSSLPEPPHLATGYENVVKVTRHSVAEESANSSSSSKSEVDIQDREPSLESLLGSLMRALNTEQGRTDFSRLTTADSSLPV